MPEVLSVDIFESLIPFLLVVGEDFCFLAGVDSIESSLVLVTLLLGTFFEMGDDVVAGVLTCWPRITVKASSLFCTCLIIFVIDE